MGFQHEGYLLPLLYLPKFLGSSKTSLLFSLCASIQTMTLKKGAFCHRPVAVSYPKKGSEIQLSVPHNLPGAGPCSVFLLIQEKGVNCYPQAADLGSPRSCAQDKWRQRSGADPAGRGRLSIPKKKNPAGDRQGEEKRSCGPVQALQGDLFHGRTAMNIPLPPALPSWGIAEALQGCSCSCWASAPPASVPGLGAAEGRSLCHVRSARSL